MISEERLREMLEVAAEGYAVPPDGAERILTLAVSPTGSAEAPQPEIDPYEIQFRRHRMRVITGWGVAASVVAVLIAALVLTGGRSGNRSDSASSSGSTSSSSGSSEAARGPAVAPQPAPVTGGSGGQGSAGADQSAPSQPSVQPRIIQTGEATLQVRVGQVPAALTQLQSLATSLGGLVEASNSQSGPEPTGSMTLRVPQAKFAQLMSRLPTVGHVVSSSSSTKDVTGQYVDLSARLKALTTTRDTYLTMMTKANTIGDTLAIQSKIDGIQQEIEQLQGEQQLLASQSALATLDVNVSETGAPATVPPDHPRSGFSAAVHRAWHRFIGGLESVVAASGTLALVLIGCALAYLGGRVLYRSVRRRMV
jgi:hypothetical protein